MSMITDDGSYKYTRQGHKARLNTNARLRPGADSRQMRAPMCVGKLVDAEGSVPSDLKTMKTGGEAMGDGSC